MVSVSFYNCDYVPDGKLTYSVIVARYRGCWVFIKHRRRKSWEIPGGHIEENETPEAAAARELTEETGAAGFDLHCVATYSVDRDGSTGYGRLFLADIHKMGEITDNSEVERIVVQKELPSPLTYPDIQPLLFARVVRYIQGRLS